MHYNISFRAGKIKLFFIKKMIHCGDEDEIAIPKPVGDMDEI